VKATTPLRRLVLGPDFTSPASTRLGRGNRLSPVGFDVAVAQLTSRRSRPCHLCGSSIPYQHRFGWCIGQLEKERERAK
jgi:hypothetical protein